MEEPKGLYLLHDYLNKLYNGEENVHFVGFDSDTNIAKYEIRIRGKWTNKKFKKNK